MDKQDKYRSKFGLRWLSILMAVLVLLIAFLLFMVSDAVSSSAKDFQESTDTYIAYQITASQLKQGSDNLTKHVRSFVVTGKKENLDYYFKELNELRTYDTAYEKLLPMVAGTPQESILKMINGYEVKIKNMEAQSILLALDAYEINDSKYRDYLSEYSVTDFMNKLEKDEKLETATKMVFASGSQQIHYGDYDMFKKIVDDNIDTLIKQMASKAQEEQMGSMNTMQESVGHLRRTTLFLMCFILVVSFAILMYVVAPLLKNIDHINKHEYLEENGVGEMKYLAKSYNQMFARVMDDQERLSYEASHDALTKLYNRQAYLDLSSEYEKRSICFLHIDIDDFKIVNDTKGHDVGDLVLQKVANILRSSFRSEDVLFRLGGDEFAVIMNGVKEGNDEIIHTKVKVLEKALADTSDGLPPVTLSIGATYSKGDNTFNVIYKEADLALYKAKSTGKGKIVFYDDSLSSSISEIK